MTMKVHFKNCQLLFLLPALLSAASSAFGQVFTTSAYSYTAAYSVLNAGTTTTASSANTYLGNMGAGVKSATSESAVSLVYQGPLDKKWNISFGIPTQVSFDYAYLRGEMVSAYENNPDLYVNGSQEFQYAVDFLGWTDFAPISSWSPVRCTVAFRFIPPVLGDNYDIKYDYRNNPSAAPDRGDVTFWIR